MLITLYIINKYWQNLYANILIHFEQLYLYIKDWFHLFKISKLHCEMLDKKNL